MTPLASYEIANSSRALLRSTKGVGEYKRLDWICMCLTYLVHHRFCSPSERTLVQHPLASALIADHSHRLRCLHPVTDQVHLHRFDHHPCFDHLDSLWRCRQWPLAPSPPSITAAGALDRFNPFLCKSNWNQNLNTFFFIVSLILKLLNGVLGFWGSDKVDKVFIIRMHSLMLLWPVLIHIW